MFLYEVRLINLLITFICLYNWTNYLHRKMYIIYYDMKLFNNKYLLNRRQMREVLIKNDQSDDLIIKIVFTTSDLHITR